MPLSTHYVACYDLTDDRERDRVAAVLEGYGLRVQKSVFECRLTRPAKERLLGDIGKLKLSSGFLYLYKLGAEVQRQSLGAAPPSRFLKSAILSLSKMHGLRELRWKKLSFRVLNVRNAYAREHPFFIFKAILKFACSTADPPIVCDYLYHPTEEPWSQRIRKGQIYNLEMVFPTADDHTVASIAAGIERQLKRQPRNFEILSMSTPEERSLTLLEREAASHLDTKAGEVCLDFLTPLEFHATDPARPWLIDAQQLIRLCTIHLARLFPSLPWPLEIDASNVQTIPYYWDPIETVWHRPKSQPGSQPLAGMSGPLYLRGDWPQLLPLLLLCGELHTGHGKGDEHGLLAQRNHHYPIASGTGAYQLRTGRSWFSPRSPG